jgi:pilus assembly protein Flp/PilA
MRNLIAKFAREEDGAAMVEYTVLLGIITATVIATVVLVADWVDGTWTNLESTLQAEAPT